MLTEPDDHQLAEILPGRWKIVATNIPLWLNGERTNPTFSYAVLGTDPLVMSDDVSYTTESGVVKNTSGVDRWHGEGFQRRGTGLRRFASSHWSVPGVTAAGTIAAIRYSKSMTTPAGINIIVREGVEPLEPRAAVASESTRFGLSAEDFASLSWLDRPPAP